MPFSLQVNIYNSAGERVRSLYNGSSQCAPQSVQALPPTLAPGQGLSSLALHCPISGGGNSIGWNGVNDQGQAVASGTYYFRMQVVSPFGQVSAWIAPVAVLDLPSQATLSIFNSAGELVYNVPLSSYPSPVASMSPDKGSLKLTLQNGSTQDFAWDGRNNQGMIVASGSYTAHLVVSSPGGSKTIQDFPVTWINPGAGPDGAPLAYPNPAHAGSQGPMISYRGPQALARLYNLAGELVAQASDTGGGLLAFHVPALAAGIYMIDFESVQAGQRSRKLIKWAVLP
jgi:hypothetical protein